MVRMTIVFAFIICATSFATASEPPLVPQSNNELVKLAINSVGVFGVDTRAEARKSFDRVNEVMKIFSQKLNKLCTDNDRKQALFEFLNEGVQVALNKGGDTQQKLENFAKTLEQKLDSKLNEIDLRLRNHESQLKLQSKKIEELEAKIDGLLKSRAVPISTPRSEPSVVPVSVETVLKPPLSQNELIATKIVPRASLCKHAKFIDRNATVAVKGYNKRFLGDLYEAHGEIVLVH